MITTEMILDRCLKIDTDETGQFIANWIRSNIDDIEEYLEGYNETVPEDQD